MPTQRACPLHRPAGRLVADARLLRAGPARCWCGQRLALVRKELLEVLNDRKNNRHSSARCSRPSSTVGSNAVALVSSVAKRSSAARQQRAWSRRVDSAASRQRASALLWRCFGRGGGDGGALSSSSVTGRPEASDRSRLRVSGRIGEQSARSHPPEAASGLGTTPQSCVSPAVRRWPPA